MEKFVIKGGRPLSGEVSISGAKNAALAIIPATILCDEPCVIENVPDISDVLIIERILIELGAVVERTEQGALRIDPRPIYCHKAVSDSVRSIRASYYLLGALLGRCKQATVALPGGCNFGVRPIDQHIKGFVAMGASERKVSGAVVELTTNGELTGARVDLDVVSVGATMNIMLAAVKAKGKTEIVNAAREPHIVDLANFLNSMGANIRGAGTNTIKVTGVERLRGTTYSIIPDQIEAGTYMAAAAATRGNVLVKNITPKHLDSITAKLREIGVKIEELDEGIRVDARNAELRPCKIKTAPHPGFPTDCQPQFVTLLSTVKGSSCVTEDVWDSRFQYVAELLNMGAKISVNGRVAFIDGVDSLNGAPVKAPDLRAGAALIIAGLCAEGVTELGNISCVERGYEDIVSKLSRIGADIRKVYYSTN